MNLPTANEISAMIESGDEEALKAAREALAENFLKAPPDIVTMTLRFLEYMAEKARAETERRSNSN